MTDNHLSQKDGTADTAPDAAEVLALCPDLLFASRIGGTARALGGEARIVRDRDALLRALAEPAEEGRRRRVLVDLTAAPDAMEAIAAVKAGHPDVAIIAFARHDATAAIRAARAAGADRVLARSAFVDRLPDILRGH